MTQDLACVVHVHSTFSDGTATAEEIVDAARSAGADALLLTDHDSLEAKRRGLEGWHDGLLLLVGFEVSPPGGHFLAFGLDEEIEHRGMTEAEIAALVRRRGGLGFAAHPFSEGSRMSRRIGRPHPWSALDGDDYTGLELWSLLTDTAEAWASPLQAVRFMRRPEAVLEGPPARHLQAWDRICSRRRCVAIGGLDAHQTGVRVRGRVFSPFPNRRFFGFLRTHVLWEGPSGDGDRDRDRVYAALRAGRCYLGADVLGSPKGFGYWAQGPGGRLAMGSEAPAGEWTLRVRLPGPASLRLIRDGRVVEVLEEATELEHAAGPGVWRVEAAREQRTWIVSNPIYLRDGAGAQPGAEGHAQAYEGHRGDHAQADDRGGRRDLAA